jgi:hypothetical protein
VPIWGGGRQSKEGGVLTKGGGAAIDRDRPRRDRKHEPDTLDPPVEADQPPLTVTEDTAAALQDLRRAQPNISLAWIGHHMPIKDYAEREHYLEGFRRAGLD